MSPSAGRSGSPTRSLLALCALLALAAVGFVPAAGATAPAGSVPIGQAAKHHRHRVGGHVRRAWPASGRAPKSRRTRWLARQVGAKRPRSCARVRRHARARCHLGRVPRTVVARLSTVGGDPGSPAGATARLTVPATPAARGVAATAAAVASPPLQLVRSFLIPADDPLYHRLLDWSWTYDSAVSAAAFAASGDRTNAGQLLDQLTALQYTDGSLEVAFNTRTGEGAKVFRSGTVAWLGLAAATYDAAFSTDRYAASEQLAADYLLSLQTSSGLIRGGPDVGWVSTQHNLVAYVFLARLASELRTAGNASSAARYQTAATALSAAIDANLLAGDGADTHFRQGLKDDTLAVDVQALGAMYLQGTGRPALASQVLAFAQRTFAVDGRSVRTSSAPDTFNQSYAADGPFSGYAPYAGPGAPDVLWAEASGEMRLAQAALGQDPGALDKSIAAWASITKGVGPLQADATVTSPAGGTEYHVWPASTAAAWTVLAQSAPAFFAAPLPPATTLVSSWTKIRGGNLITTYPDGRVAMTTVGGERRVIAGPYTESDSTVTANATLASGAGYGVYVRATADGTARLTAYCAQLDHAYGTGELVIRQISTDSELTVPIAHVKVPAGFAWYGEPHVLAVTTRGNTMSVKLDGAQILAVPDLAAASAFAVRYSSGFGAGASAPPPTAGGSGLRAWSDAVVTLQQMTVGPAA
jgi:hypothetical protein